MNGPTTATVYSVESKITSQRPLGDSLPTRNCNLDLLRAIAIIAVVFFHLIQMSPTHLPGIMHVAAAGKYGVDLFFVLSGWLIGSLYWREQAKFGRVDLMRFWKRRWMRTIPPYLVALALSWVAVRTTRNEPFDFGYLVFIQNYYERIPFFLVSWSLCIEEHFYLFIPLLIGSVGGSRFSIALLFGGLIAVSPVSRWLLAPVGVGDAFGFWTTATHLRMEGLLLGFGAAYLANFRPYGWRFVVKYAPLAVLLSLGLLGVVWFLPEVWFYRLGLTVMSVGLCGVLIYLTQQPSRRIASSRIVNWVALSSYSVYLTHALVLHIARRVTASFPTWETYLYFPLAIAMIGLVGVAFYFSVEWTSIQLRDRWVPRQTSENGSTAKLRNGNSCQKGY